MRLFDALPPVRLSDAPAVNWGGRVHRYKTTPGAVARGYDPYSLGPIAFTDEAELVAWHQVRFQADTQTLSGKRTKVQATVAGQLLTAEASFVSQTRSGQKRYHLVCDQRARREMLSALETISAHRNRATVVVHSRADVLSASHLNDRLKRLRQASVLHLRDGPSSDPLILAAVRDSACSRVALCRALRSFPEQLVDGRVAHLHCAGILTVDYTHEDYRIGLTGEGQ